MLEFVFRPLPPDLVDQIAGEATRLLGKPAVMDIEDVDECESGLARFWQEGDENKLCVTINAPDTKGNSCVHANGVDPNSPFGHLCQRLYNEGHGYPDLPVRHH